MIGVKGIRIEWNVNMSFYIFNIKYITLKFAYSWNVNMSFNKVCPSLTKRKKDRAPGPWYKDLGKPGLGQSIGPRGLARHCE